MVLGTKEIMREAQVGSSIPKVSWAEAIKTKRTKKRQDLTMGRKG
jgi:hypothetical protein